MSGGLVGAGCDGRRLRMRWPERIARAGAKLDLKIGDLVPISGAEQPFGATGEKATNLAVAEIRKAVKRVKADHTITIDHQNYRSDPKIAQDLAGKLVRAGNSCLVGPWDTAAVIPDP